MGSSPPDGRAEDISGHSRNVRLSLSIGSSTAPSDVSVLSEYCQSKFVTLHVEHAGTRDITEYRLTSTNQGVLLSITTIILFDSVQHIHTKQQTPPGHIISFKTDSKCTNTIKAIPGAD